MHKTVAEPEEPGMLQHMLVEPNGGTQEKLRKQVQCQEVQQTRQVQVAASFDKLKETNPKAVELGKLELSLD